MKKIITLLSIVAILVVFVSCKNEDTTQNTKDDNTEQVTDNTTQDVVTKTFDVKGNCNMCKDRIENASLSIDGVESADWSIDDKILTLTYQKDVDPATVLQKIADVGHDNEMFTADDEVYDALPGCCLYR